MTITIRNFSGNTVAMLAGAETFDPKYLAAFVGSAALEIVAKLEDEGQDVELYIEARRR